MISCRFCRFSLILPVLLLAGCKAGILNSDPEATAPMTAPAGANVPKPRTSPVAVGSRGPAFSLLDQQGVEVSSDELVSGGGAALLFAPSPTAPAFRAAAEYIRRNKPLIDQRRVELVLVLPVDGATAAKVAAEEGLRLAVLADPGAHVARGWGVAAKSPGGHAQPWLFFLGPDGQIHFADPLPPDATGLLIAADALPGVRRESAVPFF